MGKEQQPQSKEPGKLQTSGPSDHKPGVQEPLPGQPPLRRRRGPWPGSISTLDEIEGYSRPLSTAHESLDHPVEKQSNSPDLASEPDQKSAKMLDESRNWAITATYGPGIGITDAMQLLAEKGLLGDEPQKSPLDQDSENKFAKWKAMAAGATFGPGIGIGEALDDEKPEEF